MQKNHGVAPARPGQLLTVRAKAKEPRCWSRMLEVSSGRAGKGPVGLECRTPAVSSDLQNGGRQKGQKEQKGGRLRLSRDVSRLCISDIEIAPGAIKSDLTLKT